MVGSPLDDSPAEDWPARENHQPCTPKWTVGSMRTELQEGSRGLREEAEEGRAVELDEHFVIYFPSLEDLGRRVHLLPRLQMILGLSVEAIAIRVLQSSADTCEGKTELGCWKTRVKMADGDLFFFIQQLQLLCLVCFLICSLHLLNNTFRNHQIRLCVYIFLTWHNNECVLSSNLSHSQFLKLWIIQLPSVITSLQCQFEAILVLNLTHSWFWILPKNNDQFSLLPSLITALECQSESHFKFLFLDSTSL